MPLGSTTSLRPHGVSYSVFVLTLVLLGAGCADPGDPVGAMTLSLDRTAVPLGAPIELTLRFDALPGFVGVEEDYRVLVHFLDANEDLMWEADHDPPVPTSQWRAGQVVSYTHRATIPMYPYIGEVTVAVGLYSATTGERLVLAGEDLGERAYRGTTLNVQPQAESSFLLYEDGWHQQEFDPDSNRQWRWTSDQASLSFRNPGSDAVLYLEVDGRPDLVGSPQRITVSSGEVVLHEVMLETEEAQFLELDLAAVQLGDGDTVKLDLKIDPSFVPTELAGGGDDERRLGVRVFYSFLEPR